MIPDPAQHSVVMDDGMKGHDAPFGARFVTPLALGSTLNPINSTMISTALVAIAAEFHASVAEAGWLIAGLCLTSAVAQPTMGRLADLFGARRVYYADHLLPDADMYRSEITAGAASTLAMKEAVF